MRYKCSECGHYHEDWPALAFNSPDYYAMLSEEDKKNIAEINDDFCIIQHDTQTDHFIRTVLFQKVNDSCEPLHYGIWVSLSEKSFIEYSENFHDNKEAGYFGYLCNAIPGYENTLAIKCNVYVTSGNNRPEVVPQECDHPFVRDYINGISVEEAEHRIKEMINQTTSAEETEESNGFFRKIWNRITGKS